VSEESEGLSKELLLAEAEVLVELRDVVHSQGDRVRGTLTVIPHDRGRDGEVLPLAIELREVWGRNENDDEAGSLTTRTKSAVRDSLELSEPGERRGVVRRRGNAVQLFPATAYPFALQLPTNCRLSGRGQGWQIVIRQLESQGMPDRCRFELPVEPAEEFSALLTALTQGLRFKEDASERRWDPVERSTGFTLLPPQALREQLEALELTLIQTQDGLKGTMTWDRQEQSVADYFKALVGKDRVRRELRLRRDELVREGEVAVEALLPKLAQELEAALGS